MTGGHMPIPKYDELMLPLLECVRDGEQHRMRDLTRELGERFQLSEDEKHELLPSGQQSIIANRVGWAKTFLLKSGLLANPARGVVRITDEGIRVLGERLGKLDEAYLSRYASFVEFKNRRNTSAADL